MRLYAILVYVLTLNLVFGFVSTAITSGIFLPEAQGMITLPTTTQFQSGIDGVINAANNLQNVSGVEWLGAAFIFAGNIIAVPFQFLFSVFGTLPSFIAQIVGFPLPDSFLMIISTGLAVLTVFSAIQILTGKWFSFVE